MKRQLYKANKNRSKICANGKKIIHASFGILIAEISFVSSKAGLEIMA